MLEKIDMRNKFVYLDTIINDYLSGKFTGPYWGFNSREMISFLLKPDTITHLENRLSIALPRVYNKYYGNASIRVRPTELISIETTQKLCASITTYHKDNINFYFIMPTSRRMMLPTNRSDLKLFLTLLYHGDIPEVMIDNLVNIYFGVEYDK